MLHQQDGDAELAADHFKQIEGGGNLHPLKPGEGLVQAQHLRFGGQGDGDAQHPLQAVRQATRRHLQIILKARQLRHFAHFFPARRGIFQTVRRRDDDIVRDRHFAEQAVMLEGPDQPFAADIGGAFAGNIFIQIEKLPRGRRHEAADQVEGGAFPGAIGADEAEYFALLKVEAEIRNGRQAAEAAFKLLGF